MPSVSLTKHFIKRYRERVAKTNPERIKKFATEAYLNGKECNDLKSSKLRKKIIGSNRFHKSKSIIHKGMIYVFRDMTAVTVYKVPKHVGGVKVRL